ncbi:sensor histidine kinase [Bacteroidota bacterium]
MIAVLFYLIQRPSEFTGSHFLGAAILNSAVMIEFILLSSLILSVILVVHLFRMNRRISSCNVQLTGEITQKEMEIVHYKGKLEQYKGNIDKVLSKIDSLQKYKRTLITNLNHEIRTPLNNLMGVSNMILSDMVINDKKNLAYYAEILDSSSSRLLNVFEKVMDIESIENHKIILDLKPIPLVELLSDLIETFRKLAEKKNLIISMNIRYTPNAYADVMALHKIFHALIDNAIKFTVAGEVLITTGYLKDKNEIFVKIKDSGVGIDTDYLPYIFDSFGQENMELSRPFEGAGLGLAHAKKLLELMNGHMHITSKKNKGTTVSVFLIPYHELIKA